MSRGPRSTRALEAALPIAYRRGEVMVFEQRAGSCFDFMTRGPAGPAAVRVDRALRIHGTPAKIAADHADVIDRMNSAVLAPGISRELWLRAPWGTMRFFRIEGTTITELDMLGNERIPLVKGALAGKKRPRWRKNRKLSGAVAEPPACGPDTEAPAGTSPPTPGSPSQSAPAAREPAPVRYLRHRAAEMKRKVGGKPGGSPSAGPAASVPDSQAPGGDDHPPS